MRFEDRIKRARGVLGISADSEENEIKNRYRELAKEFHPDVNKDESAQEKMKEINEAYETIMKEVFNIPDPLKDYRNWWFSQFGGDPMWSPSIPEGKSKKMLRR